MNIFKKLIIITCALCATICLHAEIITVKSCSSDPFEAQHVYMDDKGFLAHRDPNSGKPLVQPREGKIIKPGKSEKFTLLPRIRGLNRDIVAIDRPEQRDMKTKWTEAEEDLIEVIAADDSARQDAKDGYEAFFSSRGRFPVSPFTARFNMGSVIRVVHVGKDAKRRFNAYAHEATARKDGCVVRPNGEVKH